MNAGAQFFLLSLDEAEDEVLCRPSKVWIEITTKQLNWLVINLKICQANN